MDPHLQLRPREPCESRLSCDLQGFTLPEFTSSVRIGVIALLLGAAALVWLRLPRGSGAEQAPRLVPGAGGLLLAAAAAEAYRETGHLLPGLGLAIGMLFAAGVVADAFHSVLVVRVLLGLPGGWVLASHTALEPLVPAWVRLVVAVAPAVGGALVADIDRRNARLGVGPVLVAVSFVGLYETVPDTDLALVLLGVGLPLALLAWPVALTSLGGGGAAVAVGLISFVAAVGGRGRLSAVVGGVGCLGLLAIEPLALRLHPRRWSPLERLPGRPASTVAVGLAHLVLVYLASRVAGLRPTVREATVIALLTSGAGLAIWIVTAAMLGPSRSEAGMDRP